MKRLILAAMLVATPVFAQQQMQVPSEYNLKIVPADVDTIGKALGKMPFDEVAPLIQKLREQISQQQQALNAPKPEQKKE